ncbi:DUF6624 domain-containing protein [Nocardioides sp.]|uniref:DUF6624 domain-containing protein n=1 Tax=Nocardioides sp. TaxID=35761 RepID=UPI0027181551|nr:DUF6624 domain-containing protein [Nocardioides sp.]MDO9456194.1 hypothetical protein [Nocardioides sp.]
MKVLAGLVVVPLLLALAACDGDEGPTDVEAPSQTAVETATASDAPSDPALRDELVAMLQRDQDERTGIDSDDETDQDRADRLEEIIAERGWPGYDLVGKEGAEAAWTITQHADLDPAFQARAAGLLRAAVEAGQAAPGNLAFLEDRVAVARGKAQTYGTQVDCGPDGPTPATPVRDPDQVDARRTEVGLGTYEDYLTEISEACASGS